MIIEYCLDADVVMIQLDSSNILIFPLLDILKHKDSFGKSENLSKIFFRRNSSIWSWLWRQVIEQ